MAEEGYIGAADLLEQGDGAATPSIAEPIGNSGSGAKYQAPEISPATVASGDGEYRSATDALAESGPFEPARDPSSFARRALGDTAVSLWKGGVEGAKGAVGLADLATGGQAGKLAEEAGLDFDGTTKKIATLYSPEAKAANAKVEEAQGFVPTLKAIGENPSTIPNIIAESIPSMVGGQGIGKLVMKGAPGLSALAAGSIGDATVTAGQQAEDVRGQTEDGLLTGKQSLLSAGSGALTGLITHGSGKFANKFGIDDINTLGLRKDAEKGAAEEVAEKAGRGIFSRALIGGGLEGGEELIQSGQEKAATNVALDRPFDEGIGNAAAMGMVAGIGMGVPMAALSNHNRTANTEDKGDTDQGRLPGTEENTSLPTEQPTTPVAEAETANRTADYVNRVHDIAKANPEIYDKLPLTGALKLAAENNGIDLEGKTSRQVFQELDDLVNPKTPEQLKAREVEQAGNTALEETTAEIKASLGDSNGLMTRAITPLVEKGQTEKQKNTKAAAESGVLAAQEQAVPEAPVNDPNQVIGTPTPEAEPDDEFIQAMRRHSTSGLEGLLRDSTATNKQLKVIKDELAARENPSYTANRDDNPDRLIVYPTPAEQPAESAVVDPIEEFKASIKGINDRQLQAMKMQRVITPEQRAAINEELASRVQQTQEQTDSQDVITQTDPTITEPQPAPQGASANSADPVGGGQATQPAAQEQPAQKAKELLLRAAPNGDLNALAGKDNAKTRAHILAVLTDQGRVPTTSATIPALREAFYSAAGIGEDTSAGQAQRFSAWVTQTQPTIQDQTDVQSQNQTAQPVTGQTDQGQKVQEVVQAGGQVQPQEVAVPATPVDDAANLVVTSRNNAHTAPQEDIQNGNYAKAPVQFQNLTLTMENAKGSFREGTDKDGKQWSQELHDNYGDIFGTVGADGDPVDVFVKHGMTEDGISKANKVFIVDQKDPKTGAFDEHKVMLGYNSLREAKEAYLRNYEPGWAGIKNITGVSMVDFQKWVNEGDTKKPFKQPKPRKPLNDRLIVAPEKDDLIRAIAKLGGVNRTHAVSQGLDVQDGKKNAKFGFNIYPTFNSRSDETFDGMAETLRQYGFQGRDGAELDAGELLAMVTESVNQGVVHMTPEGNARLVAEMAEENYTQEQAQFSLRLQDLLVKAQQISEDEYKAMKEVIAKGYITPDNIDDEEADLDDYIARRSTENSETGDRESRGEEPLLQDYSQEELEQRNSDQKQKVSEIAEQEFAEIRKAVAAKSVDTIVDEMFGDTGRTEDVFGMTNPMQKPMFSRQKLPEIIEINGKDRWTINSDGSPIALTEEGVRNFWRWFGDSKVVDEDGKPLVLYHGTTGDFTSFDLSKANPESDLGVGVYMSNTVDDVGNNYAGEGPDLTSKLEKLAERIAGETDREYDDPEVVKEAKAALSIQNQGFTMPVFTAIKNPVVIGGNNETSLTYEEGYDEDTEEYGEPEGTLVEFMDALRDVVAENEYDEADAEQAIGDAYEKLGGEYEVQVSDLIAALKGAEGLVYASNEDGDSVANEIIREAFERIGFDGYIDHTVDQKFGSQRQYGKAMSGMDEDTVHYVAFRPRAVKSALGNSGAFGEDTSDIRYSQTENTETTLFGNAEQAKKALVDTFGEGINRLITNRILNFTQGKEDWPSAAQEAAIGDEEAVYINGRVYIDLAATSTERMTPVVLHEIGEHFNLKYMIGSAAYRSLQDQIANRATRMGTAEAKVWAEVKRSYTHLDEGSEAFVSEVIAKLGENNPKTPWYRRLLSQIKSFMMRYGLARGIVAGTITDADMHDLLTASLRSAARDLNRQKPALFGGSINPKFSFAGEGAYTADQDALERANSRLSKGEDAETVRKDTGWHQGDDGKMRFEIDDSKAEFSSTGTFDEAMMKAYVEGRNKTNGTRYTVTIGDLMAHKDLYDAYPELADITVTMLPAESPNLGEMATLENGEPTVRIREDLPRDEWASVILHELQHGIQAFEGFAIGGSVDDISQEDFAEAKRAKLTELMDTASAYTVMGDELAAASTRMQIRNLRRLATFEAYQRLSGEVEARNTQTRQNLSAEQRRDTAPRDTVDVDGKPIVVFANQAESSAAQFSRQDNTGTPAGDFEEAERSWLGQVAEKLDKMSDKAFSQRFAVLSVEQMAEVAQRYLPGLKGYVALQRERRAEIETVMRGADRLVTEVWKKLSKKEQHELAATMHDSTLADVDASKAWFGVENLDPKNPRSIRFKAFTQSVLTRYSQGELKRAAESLGAVSFNKNSVVFKTEDQANEFLGRLKEIEQNQSEALSVLEREDVNTSRKSDHALVAQKFAAMSKGAQQVYVETHEHHMSLFNRRIDALVQRIDDVVLDGKVKAAMIAEIRKEFESKSLNWYYAPLQRFGDYWIYGTNSEGVKVFSTYESERAWVAAEKRFKATGGELHGSGKSLSNLQSAGIEGVSDSFVADIQTLLNETLGEDDPAAKNLKDQVYQMYLDKLPSVSARHSSMHRKGTKGFELDAMRSFSHAIHHGATQLANMKYGREMGEVLKTQQKALDYANSPYLKDESLEEIAATQLLLADWAKMSQEGVLEGDMSVAKTEEDEDKIKVLKRAITLRNRLIDTPDTKAIVALERIEKRHKDLITAAEKIMPGDKKRASDIINEMLGAYQEALRTNSTAMDRIATGLNQFNFMWMLGFSLSAGIVNTLQTPGVAMPITAGRYGIAKTISAYNRAYTEFMSSLTHQKLDDDGNVSITGVLVDRYLELIAAGKDAEAMKVAREIEAFELFKNGGDISKTRSFDLIGVGREGGLHGGAVHNLSMKAGWMFHHGERFNREVTLMANFRLATESGMDFSQAIEYARSVNNRAHLDYSSENASRIFRGATAKIAFQFKKYQQGMLYLWIKSATDALGKVDPDNYPNGKNDDGYKADVEKRIEARGTFMALLAMQSALAGTMGLPMVGMISVIYGMIGQAAGDEDDPWDLEKDYRLGLSKLFGDQAGEALAKGLVNTFTDINLASRLDMKDIFFREPMKELEGRDAATAYAAQLLGPTGGSLAKLWQGFSFFADGQPLRGAEAITPKFLGDLAKAARYATEGAKTLDGLPLKDMKDTESFMQAVGFGSSKLERMYAERDFVKKDEIAISAVRSKLVHRAAQAKIAREPVPMMEIRAFNMKHPTDQIKNAHILASKRAIKRNTKARGDRGYTVNRKLNYLLEENELLD
jgi:hypothetical protein